MKTKKIPKKTTKKTVPLTMTITLIHALEGRVDRLEAAMARAQRAMPHVEWADE